ncbi:hypothetical protein AB0442_22440 [Kitasatospora sp. NPDC085895]
MLTGGTAAWACDDEPAPSATAFPFASGGVLLALGGGVLLAVKRLARR